jgi:hypothetical protein
MFAVLSIAGSRADLDRRCPTFAAGRDRLDYHRSQNAAAVLVRVDDRGAVEMLKCCGTWVWKIQADRDLFDSIVRAVRSCRRPSLTN